MGWDAKRDRWNGFEAEEYDGVVNEYRALEELKKIENSGHNGQQDPDVGDAENASHSLVAAPEERYQEESDMGRNQSNSTRQLRIREDTAKYLINLDLDSARYDPKTRSMVDGGAMEDQSSKLVQEEGFVRGSGEAGEFARAQRYAWEVQEGLIIPGSNESRDGRENFPSNSIAQMHLQANPTEGEYLRRQAIETANKRKSEHKKALHEKYGTDPKASTAIPLLTGVTENEQYVEYDDDGEIKNAKIDIKQSQYEENILVGNHTRVWGSFWEDFRWGFACCQQMEKRSYCTGQKGIEAKIEANDFAILESRMLQNGAHHAHPSEEPFEDQESSARGSVGQRGGPDEDRARKRTWEPKKRTLEEMRSGIDEKELDEWRKKRAMGDDPMSKFLGSDEVAPV